MGQGWAGKLLGAATLEVGGSGGEGGGAVSDLFLTVNDFLDFFYMCFCIFALEPRTKVELCVEVVCARAFQQHKIQP